MKKLLLFTMIALTGNLTFTAAGPVRRALTQKEMTLEIINAGKQKRAGGLNPSITPQTAATPRIPAARTTATTAQSTSYLQQTANWLFSKVQKSTVPATTLPKELHVPQFETDVVHKEQVPTFFLSQEELEATLKSKTESTEQGKETTIPTSHANPDYNETTLHHEVGVPNELMLYESHEPFLLPLVQQQPVQPTVSQALENSVTVYQPAENTVIAHQEPAPFVLVSSQPPAVINVEPAQPKNLLSAPTAASIGASALVVAGGTAFAAVTKKAPGKNAVASFVRTGVARTSAAPARVAQQVRVTMTSATQVAHEASALVAHQATPAHNAMQNVAKKFNMQGKYIIERTKNNFTVVEVGNQAQKYTVEATPEIHTQLNNLLGNGFTNYLEKDGSKIIIDLKEFAQSFKQPHALPHSPESAVHFTPKNTSSAPRLPEAIELPSQPKAIEAPKPDVNLAVDAPKAPEVTITKPVAEVKASPNKPNAAENLRLQAENAELARLEAEEAHIAKRAEEQAQAELAQAEEAQLVELELLKKQAKKDAQLAEQVRLDALEVARLKDNAAKLAKEAKINPNGAETDLAQAAQKAKAKTMRLELEQKAKQKEQSQQKKDWKKAAKEKAEQQETGLGNAIAEEAKVQADALQAPKAVEVPAVVVQQAPKNVIAKTAASKKAPKNKTAEQSFKADTQKANTFLRAENTELEALKLRAAKDIQKSKIAEITDEAKARFKDALDFFRRNIAQLKRDTKEAYTTLRKEGAQFVQLKPKPADIPPVIQPAPKPVIAQKPQAKSFQDALDYFRNIEKDLQKRRAAELNRLRLKAENNARLKAPQQAKPANVPAVILPAPKPKPTALPTPAVIEMPATQAKALQLVKAEARIPAVIKRGKATALRTPRVIEMPATQATALRVINPAEVRVPAIFRVTPKPTRPRPLPNVVRPLAATTHNPILPQVPPVRPPFKLPVHKLNPHLFDSKGTGTDPEPAKTTPPLSQPIETQTEPAPEPVKEIEEPVEQPKTINPPREENNGKSDDTKAPTRLVPATQPNEPETPSASPIQPEPTVAPAPSLPRAEKYVPFKDRKILQGGVIIGTSTALKPSTVAPSADTTPALTPMPTVGRVSGMGHTPVIADKNSTLPTTTKPMAYPLSTVSRSDYQPTRTAHTASQAIVPTCELSDSDDLSVLKDSPVTTLPTTEKSLFTQIQEVTEYVVTTLIIKPLTTFFSSIKDAISRFFN